MIYDFRIYIEEILTHWNLTELQAEELAAFTALTSVVLMSLLLAYICQRFLVPLILNLVAHTETKWDDYLVNRPVLRGTCMLLPALLIYYALPYCFDQHTTPLYVLLERLSQVYIAFSSMMLVSAFLKNITKVAIHELEEHHLVGILQFLRLLTFCLGAIIMVSLLLGNNPLRVIAGLGAAATVLMLVFKDSILGLVAGIQLSMNNMLKVGDWVTIQKLGIDGTVEEVSLTTVKVRNFDNTISTVPPYTLVSDSFQNWNAMFTKGYRRVKRALYMDIQSVRFVTEEEKETLRRKKLISKTDAEQPRITNLTLFRHFVVNTLREDKKISDEQWVLARQLAPTPTGLPLEIWFYSAETSFVRYEDFASDYMELFIASLSEFGLRHYQAPSSADFRFLATGKGEPPARFI